MYQLLLAGDPFNQTAQHITAYQATNGNSNAATADLFQHFLTEIVLADGHCLFCNIFQILGRNDYTVARK